MVLPWHTGSRREHEAPSATKSAHVATRGALALLEEAPAERINTLAAWPDAAGNDVLLALDDALLAGAMRDALLTQGDPAWVVRLAHDAAQALELARTRPPRLALLDIITADVSSGEADGAAIYRQLRANPASARTPVIFATAATSLDLYERGIQEGLLLRKPFDLGELVQLVRELLAC
jgi:DNA-binding response OmpR family regulator